MIAGSVACPNSQIESSCDDVAVAGSSRLLRRLLLGSTFFVEVEDVSESQEEYCDTSAQADLVLGMSSHRFVPCSDPNEPISYDPCFKHWAEGVVASR